MSERGGKLALLSAGAAIALAVGEGIVRVSGLAPVLAPIRLDEPHGSFVSSPNPRLRYVPRSGAGDINDEGFRDRRYSLSKPEGTFRIAVIGDSIGFGYCNLSGPLRLDETFPKQLERGLNGRAAGDRRFEVLNFSVSGYDTVQEVEFLRVKALAYRPDLVLVAYCLNDVGDASLELGRFREDPDWQSRRSLRTRWVRLAVTHSHLVRLVWYLAAGSAGTAEAPDPMAGGDRTIRGYAALRELSDRAGFATAVAVFPFSRDLEPYPFEAPHGAARAKAVAMGFGVIDLLPGFRRAARSEDLWSPCIGSHPNRRGHELAARLIADQLTRDGVVSDRGRRPPAPE